MAKRFIDTDIFKKKFIRGLQGAYKLLWIYIFSDCNHAGIWEVDFEIAEIYTGFKYPEINKILEYFKEKIIAVDNGTKWFIPSFIEFQYGSILNPKNKAHNSVISILKKYDLYKGLTSPLEGVKDKDKDKDKDMDQGGAGGIKNSNPATGKYIPPQENELMERSAEIAQMLTEQTSIRIFCQREFKMTEKAIKHQIGKFVKAKVFATQDIHQDDKHYIRYFMNWLALQKKQK